MNFESFSIGSSILHRIDVRFKIIAAFLFSLVVALCQSLPAPLLALAIAGIMLRVSRLPSVAVGRRLVVVNLFTLFFWLTLPFTVPGPVLLGLGPVVFTEAGVDLATLITLKTNAIVLTFLALVTTSGMAELGHGLAALKLPSRLCMLLLFTYRYISVLQQEFQRLRRAALLRGFKPTTSMHTYRTFGNLLGMTLVKSWRRGLRVQQAMVLRGFQGQFYVRACRRSGPADWGLLVLIFFASLAVVIVEQGASAGGCP